jgi:Ala-tRNA(Pro) deacylase
MVDETDLPLLFRDCQLGAVPPIGDAYGMRTLVEVDLRAQQDLYLEGGDHEHLLHVDRETFVRLTPRATEGHFSYAI